MEQRKWIIAIVAIAAFSLIAAGCGSDDSSTTTAATDTATATTESTSTSDTATTGASPDDVYNECIDAIGGSDASSAYKDTCSQARDTLEQCTQEAESTPEGSARDAAIQACQDAADITVNSLKASG